MSKQSNSSKSQLDTRALKTLALRCYDMMEGYSVAGFILPKHYNLTIRALSDASSRRLLTGRVNIYDSLKPSKLVSPKIEENKAFYKDVVNNLNESYRDEFRGYFRKVVAMRKKERLAKNERSLPRGNSAREQLSSIIRDDSSSIDTSTSNVTRGDTPRPRRVIDYRNSTREHLNIDLDFIKNSLKEISKKNIRFSSSRPKVSKGIFDSREVARKVGFQRVPSNHPIEFVSKQDPRKNVVTAFNKLVDLQEVLQDYSPPSRSIFSRSRSDSEVINTMEISGKIQEFKQAVARIGFTGDITTAEQIGEASRFLKSKIKSAEFQSVQETPFVIDKSKLRQVVRREQPESHIHPIDANAKISHRSPQAWR